MRQIPSEEVRFHPHSFGDPAGRLLTWRGGLYRAITPGWAPFLESLLRDPVIRRLMSDGLLIETEAVPLALPPYAMVVRHRRIEFPSYAEEWCPSMLKDGALAVLQLAAQLAEAGLMLKDGHCWNLLFDGPRPVYVDVTSIAPIDGAVIWPAYDELTRFFLNPLRCMERGLDRVARRLLPHGQGVLRSDVAALIDGPRARPLVSLGQPVGAAFLRGRALVARRLFGRRPDQPLQRGPAPSSYRDHLRAALREIEQVALPSFSDRPHRAPASGRNGLPPRLEARHRQLSAIIDRLRPSSIVVVEGAHGEAPFLAGRVAAHAASFSVDIDAVTREYHAAQLRQLPLLPLVLDFADPTPSRGIDSHSTISAHERLGGQLVVGPGSPPTVATERYLRTEQIVRGLAAFSTQWLVLNGVPRAPLANGTTSANGAGWHLGALRPVLEDQFPRVDVVRIERCDDVLMVCER
jgi:hypothetical protein